ncbi:hypothetical protein E9993_14555 [Labilibacter sediminis]|nr:hypothetical protein E9993_14555 [Labilibacter sediminis]
MIKYKYLTLLLGILLFTQCELQYKDFEPSAGNADFSSVVTIGDSYTAGYMDNALFKQGQENSFAGILSQQLMKTANLEIKAPLFPEDKSVGGALNGRYVLASIGGSLVPVPTDGNPELLTDPLTWINGDAPFANVGVPAAKAIHLVVPEFGNPTLGPGKFNPYYARFASNPGVSTVVGDALLNTPTFFTYWAGIYDVLDYALAGGEGSTAGVDPGDITEITAFTQAYKGAMAMLSASANKGAIANIPAVLDFAFFNTIPYNGLVLTEEKAQGLNAAYEAYPNIQFSEGPNAFVVLDAFGLRQLEANEKILLTAQTGILTEGWGSLVPMPTDVVINKTEVAAIETATESFNAVIEDEADTYGLALVKTDALFNKLKNGFYVDGNAYNSVFVKGGFYSLDGIHPTERGACIIANEFIKAINSTYDASIPGADVNQYEGVEFPE